MVKSKEAQADLGVKNNSGRNRGNAVVFTIAALDMSWRLAITVLVPLVGGFELDKHLGTTPALTIIGFLVAMVGVFLLLRQIVANADDKFKKTGTRQ